MSASGKKLALSVCCSDWRLHQASVRTEEAISAALGADAVDVVAFPGPDGVTVSGRDEDKEALVRWMQLLIDAHHPDCVALVAHYNCAGHPVTDAEHDEAVTHAVKELKKALTFDGPIVGMCAEHHADDNWPLKKIIEV